MSAASELDERLGELQKEVGELVTRLEAVQSLQESLAETASNLAGASENVSKLVVELRSVVGTLETIPQFFKATVAAFERTEPTKMVDDITARLDELGKVVTEVEAKTVEATRARELLAEQNRALRRTVRQFGFGLLAAIVVASTVLWLLSSI